MKANKLPKSGWSDSQEAGSQSQQTSQSSSYYLDKDNAQKAGYASNDASYNHDESNDEYPSHSVKNTSSQDSYFGYKSAVKSLLKAKESAMSDDDITKNNDLKSSVEQSQGLTLSTPITSESVGGQIKITKDKYEHRDSEQETDSSSDTTHSSYKEIPERIFMNGLIKHTGIALAIIIPLAAFSAYAATPPVNAASMAATNATMDKTTTEMLSIEPSAIIHKSVNTPTTVDSVDLEKYAGTWYEIGRLPMYFQRKCAGDVTANYAQKADGKGITVTNKCMAEDGSEIVAEGLAKPTDETGSKLKVTFLPSWIRWLPVGRADYWVLARDADYKTALVGTPDKDYLWLLARSPNVSQETYSKYRQIAQQQGYDLKEFKLTPQTNQTVNLTP
ncbi:lipocalin family protein [Psychrobacter fozii]|uniref:Apolipoprotein D and lipocalin family protein n=1 Tax=Psychrobacter fozii TaxID=198480 RepID=A0A2V4V2T0_9GAMM|nr:lipocalin family protein [Psychrobacter fozii]PYE40211.1 apolipoprotein D and lipocalin family protein [Psychrobacter fozii]